MSADFHLDASNTFVDPGAELFLKLFERIGSETAAAVDRHAFTHCSQYRHERQIKQPRFQVPERGVNCSNGHRDNARTAQISNRVYHCRPCSVYGHRIAAHNYGRQEVFDQQCGRRIGVRVAEAGYTSAGCFDDHQRRLVPGERAVTFRTICRNDERRHVEAFNWDFNPFALTTRDCRHLQITSRILSFTTVLMIFQRSFSPRKSASANFKDCFIVMLPGRGGSFGSTTASTTARPP